MLVDHVEPVPEDAPLDDRFGQLCERFARTADNTLTYTFTVDDPTTWAKPWTAEIPWTKTKGPVYESACHEGNNMIVNILRGARVAEAEAAKKGK